MRLLRTIVVPLWFFASCFALIVVGVFPKNRPGLQQLFGRWVSTPLLRILGIRLELRNAERLETSQPCIFVPNHQSMLDVATIGSLFPRRTTCIGKKSLRFLPFFAQYYQWAGHLFIDRGNSERAMNTMRVAEKKIVDEKLSVLIAPEGTRSGNRGLLDFKKGPFRLAINTGLPLQPMAVSSYCRALNFRRWHAGTVIISFPEPIPVAGRKGDVVAQLQQELRDSLNRAIAEVDADFSRPA